MEKSITKKQLVEFGFLIGFGFPIIIGFILPLIGGHEFRAWTLWIGLPSLILAISRPQLLLYPYKGWIKLGYLLGWINSRIVLGLVYFIILIPIALIMRFFGYDPLRNKKNGNESSYRENKKNKLIDLNRIF